MECAINKVDVSTETASQPAPLLTMSGAGVFFPTGTMALNAVTLSVAAGEFLSVVGPSGCGKSTLLRVAAGLLAPTEGTLERGAGRVGFVFQDPTLLPWRTVLGNVELVGELTKLARAQRRARALEALARVGLADVAARRPATLSVGMRMRVSLARTLAVRPELLMFDEPFAAVDELSRARLGEDLQALFVADRFGALFVTHSVAEAVYLSTRVLVMSDGPGRIVGEVEVPLPYPRPPDLRYTAEFTALTAKVHELLQNTTLSEGQQVAAR